MWNDCDDLKQRFAFIRTAVLARMVSRSKQQTNREKKKQKTHNEDIKLTNKYKIIEREWNARLPSDNKVVIIIAKDFFCSENDEDCDAAHKANQPKRTTNGVHKYARHETNSWRTGTATRALGCVRVCEWKVWPIFVVENIGQIMFGAYAVRPWVWWRSILQGRRETWLCSLSPCVFNVYVCNALI